MATALKALCDKYQISVRRLATICGNRIGKSSAHKLIQGTADSAYASHAIPDVAVSLAAFLAAKGLPADQIRDEVRAIFPAIEDDWTEKAGVSATTIVRNFEGRIVRVIEISL
jgi:hypothetical protein